MRRRDFAWMGAAALCAPEARAQVQQHALFIGNSYTYTNNLPGLVQALFQTAGLNLEVSMVANPDFSLGDHWRERAARRAIQRKRWSFVVLQQGPSSQADSRRQLREHVSWFAPLIRAAGAIPALYSTWPMHSRMIDFAPAELSYALAAADVGGILLPAAGAWRHAFDLAPDVQLYDNDGLHPNAHGSLLAALTIFGGLSGRSPLELPSSIALRRDRAENITQLQQAAANALAGVAASAR